MTPQNTNVIHDFIVSRLFKICSQSMLPTIHCFVDWFATLGLWLFRPFDPSSIDVEGLYANAQFGLCSPAVFLSDRIGRQSMVA